MKLFIGLIIAGFALAAYAMQVAGNAITLNDEEKAACESGGGCVLVTRDALRALVQRAYTKGALPCRDQT